MTNKILAIVAAGMVAGPMTASAAAILIGSGGQVYTQNFDSLTSTATTGQAWTNDSTLAGWSLFRQPAPGTALTTYAGGTGSNNTGSFYSFGAAGSGERALGGVGSGGAYWGSPTSGAVAGWMAVALQNTSGVNLDGFALSFDGEQWRNGGNTSTQSMVFEYGFGASFTSVASWFQPGGMFDWASVVNSATAAAVDGNVAGLVVGRGGAISTLWTADSTLWLRWIERNDVGNDHGLAIDNVSFTAGRAVAVPEPATLALFGLGLAGIGAMRRKKLAA